MLWNRKDEANIQGYYLEVGLQEVRNFTSLMNLVPLEQQDKEVTHLPTSWKQKAALTRHTLCWHPDLNAVSQNCEDMNSYSL